jgi:hypothetical protein
VSYPSLSSSVAADVNSWAGWGGGCSAVQDGNNKNDIAARPLLNNNRTRPPNARVHCMDMDGRRESRR